MDREAAQAGQPAPRRLRSVSRVRLHPDLLLTGGLFLGALLLRAWGITWSLPYVGHVDEPKIVDAAVRILKTGDLNPHLFIWPSLIIYIQMLIDGANLLWGTWRGYYSGPASLPDSNHVFALAPGLYLWGRAFSALVGAGAVAGCYLLGRALFGRPAAMIAALLLLTSPIHVEYSHYLVTDVPMGATGLLALAAAWRLGAHPGLRTAGLAGAAIGLCAAAKYNGAYVALPALAAWALAAWRPGPGRSRVLQAGSALLALGGGAGAAFLLTNPYVLLAWPEWSRGFLFQVNAYLPADNLEQMGQDFGRYVAALWNTDPPLLAAGVLGSLVLAFDALHTGRRNPALRRVAALLLPFPVLYTALMSRFTEVFERNLIVILPFLCLPAGYGLARLLARVGRRQYAVGGDEGSEDATQNATFNIQHSTRFTFYASMLGLLLAAEPARRMINFDSYMALPESRNQAWAWLGAELQAGHRAAVELHPWQVCAPPPHACAAPDIHAPNTALTVQPPAWYAAHGYDYVVLSGPQSAILGDPERSGPRPPADLAPYLALPEVRRFAGDAGGEKGPTVLVLRTALAPGGPTGATRSGARFGALAELWGYALAPLATAGETYDPAASPAPPGPYRPGAAAGVNLYWRALPGSAALPGTWTVALHLLDAAGRTVAQVDVQPISSGRLRPAREWYPGEFLAGAYNISLPATLPPGPYRLTLALYDAPAGPALRVQAPAQPSTAQLDLGTLMVGP